MDAGYNVFAYAFATPGTTQASTASNTAYDCIFNIINQDDLVPQLPMSAWGFTRYGQNVPGSIEATSGYAGEWDDLMGGSLSYTSNKTSMENVVARLSEVADVRNDCYIYPDGGFYTVDGYYSRALANNAATALANSYPINTANTYEWSLGGASGNYAYHMYQQPAFLMQLIAANMGGVLPDQTFALLMTPTYLWEAKGALTSFASAGYANHPHYPESYYLLATKIS